MHVALNKLDREAQQDTGESRRELVKAIRPAYRAKVLRRTAEQNLNHPSTTSGCCTDQLSHLEGKPAHISHTITS